MKLPKTPEACAVAAFIDTLDEETRQYLHGMVYRVAGVEPPPPPQSKQPSTVASNVIELPSAPRGSSGASAQALPAGCDGRSARRKHPGTGVGDTSQETWDAMRAAYEKGGEPLTDIARRFGVLYSAAHSMLWHWNRERRGLEHGQRELGKPSVCAAYGWSTPLAGGNVIAFPRR